MTDRADPVPQAEQIGGAFLEIRPAEGGPDATVWALDLLEIYLGYAEPRAWRSADWQVPYWAGTAPVAGVTEAVVALESNEAYRRLYWETGAHRVPRVPVFGFGRIHTSAATICCAAETRRTGGGTR